MNTLELQAEAVERFNNSVHGDANLSEFRDWAVTLTPRQVYEAVSAITFHCKPVVFGRDRQGWSRPRLLGLMDLMTH